MTKAYAGALEGTGAAELLMAQLGDAGGYVASERIEGTLAGRTGTFVVQHGAVGDATDRARSATSCPARAPAGWRRCAATRASPTSASR